MWHPIYVADMPGDILIVNSHTVVQNNLSRDSRVCLMLAGDYCVIYLCHLVEK